MRVLLVLTFLSSDECNYNSWNFFWQLLGYWYGFFEFFLFFQSKSESHFLCLHFWNFAGTSPLSSQYRHCLSVNSHFDSAVLISRSQSASVQDSGLCVKKLKQQSKNLRKNLVKLWCTKNRRVKIVKNQRCPFPQSSRITRTYWDHFIKWVIWQSVRIRIYRRQISSITWSVMPL